jgi:hypothetical protein
MGIYVELIDYSLDFRAIHLETKMPSIIPEIP